MNELIKELLESIGIPIAYQEYTESEPQYVRFFYLPQVDFQADDDEIYNTIYVQVDVFTPYDPNPIAKKVKELMKRAGFKKNFEHEQFEEDTKLFHYAQRFWIIKEEF